MARTLAFLTACVVGAVAPLVVTPQTHGVAPAAFAVAGDTDGDGFAAPDDCGPLDPTIRPGAPDRPDLGFTDTNCDGIDGDAAGAVFVATSGSDSATGTKANPLQTVNAGVTKALAAGKDVYVAGGSYNQTVNLADGVGIYGGYAPGDWVRSESEPTEITGASGPGALGVGDVGVVLQGLSLRGTPDGSGNSYGLRVVPEGAEKSQVALEDVLVSAAAGVAGASGGTGGSGLTGFGFAGGSGGFGGCGNGSGGQPGLLGGSGAAGSIGASGTNGSFSVPAAVSWTRPVAGAGGQGGAGSGGRGGTGGFGATGTFGSTLCGGRGGTGGVGGGGGFGGGGGQGGGGSFGIYAFDSSVVAVGSSLTSGNGGAGGAGGNGGAGGGPTGGLTGAAGQCETIIITVCAGVGGTGFTGFAGGQGGRGGGGAGGPSAAVYQGGPASGFTNKSSTLATGSGGAGGVGGTGSGQAGAAQQVLRPVGAPTASTYDFDGDGLNDTADACPADAAGSSGQAGCPTGPQTTITSGPADGGYLLSNRATIGFGSSAGSPTFTCSLDGGDGTACSSPRSLTGLSGRTHAFRVWSSDGSGAADPSAALRTFTVPRNNTALSHSRGWTRRTGSGYFLDSYSTTTRRGAVLSTSVNGAEGLALVASKGRGFGKVNVMLGRTRLAQVDLSASRLQKKRLIPVPLTALATGTVKVVVVTGGKEVRIEGLGVAAP